MQQDLSLITPVHSQDDDTNYTQENTVGSFEIIWCLTSHVRIEGVSVVLIDYFLGKTVPTVFGIQDTNKAGE